MTCSDIFPPEFARRHTGFLLESCAEIEFVRESAERGDLTQRVFLTAEQPFHIVEPEIIYIAHRGLPGVDPEFTYKRGF